jgi:hypothetical protein
MPARKVVVDYCAGELPRKGDLVCINNLYFKVFAVVFPLADESKPACMGVSNLVQRGFIEVHVASTPSPLTQQQSAEMSSGG